MTTHTPNAWFIYIVECADGSFYTGITTDTERRIAEHNSTTKGARYTRARQPVKLRYTEQALNRSEASKREYKIKKLSRAQKLELF